MTKWHIIRCVSGQEARAERYLERMGYPYGWHPVEKIRVPQQIFERLLSSWRQRGGRKEDKPKQYTKRPYVHGYVFLPAQSIDPDRIKRNPYGAWMEVLCVGEVPYTLTDEQMTAMRVIPDRLKEMLEEAERAAREEWEAKRPKVGELARIIEGPFAGKKWRVEEMREGYVWLDGGAMFGAFRIVETKVERAV